MISIESVVSIVFFVICAAAIFGLLHFAISYCEKQFPTETPFYKFAHIFLVIVAVFVLIGIILGAMGHPIIAWGH